MKKLNMKMVQEACDKIASKLIEDGYELSDMNFVCDQDDCECANAEKPEVNLTVIVADKLDSEYADEVAAAGDLPCESAYVDGPALNDGEEGVSQIAIANENDPLMPPPIATYIECKLGPEFFRELNEAEEKAELKKAAKEKYKNKSGEAPTTVEKPRKTKEIADESDATAKSRISKVNYGDLDKYAHSNTASNPKVRTFRSNAEYKKVQESKRKLHEHEMNEKHSVAWYCEDYDLTENEINFIADYLEERGILEVPENNDFDVELATEISLDTFCSALNALKNSDVYGSDYEEPEDEDYFTVEVNDHGSTARINISKGDDGKWHEMLGEHDDDFYHRPRNYMSYLKKDDIMTWLRQDYDSVWPI